MQNYSAHPYLLNGQYSAAIAYYESLIQQSPDATSAYWYLGLALLLQGDELEAQTTWFFALEADSLSTTESTREQGEEGEWMVAEEKLCDLVATLDQEASRQAEQGQLEKAWLIRQHIRELAPQHLENLEQILTLAIQLENISSQVLEDLDLATALYSGSELGTLDPHLPIAILKVACECHSQETWVLDLATILKPYIEPLEQLKCLLAHSVWLAYNLNRPDLSIPYLELCLEIDDQQADVLVHLSALYRELGDFEAALKTAKQLLKTCKTNIDFIHSAGVMIQTLLRAGRYWSEVLLFTEELSQSLHSLVTSAVYLDRIQTYRLLTATSFLAYIADHAPSNRQLQNQTSVFCQNSIQHYERQRYEQYCYQNSQRKPETLSRPLRIGYLSHCLREHSVGWLARWPYVYHDRNQFEIHTYFVTYRNQDFLQDWYVRYSDYSHPFQRNVLDIADQISQDQIDILIDLDSLTLDLNLELLALKPAPIQVTWLGWDASGLPAIDYYLADPYALPPNAQNYYSEKIIRLPKTYLAVDGFEVATPSISRSSLDIPNNSVIYFSSQSNAKRNPSNIKLQMQIIASVPNSYFLIKGINRNIQYSLDYFESLAVEAGVQPDRLRFLDMVSSSQVHRANLAIADVVLDTYPYNGATTTLETLWMGVPLVTRVGQQFSARNSYTFMMNAGITEGIAWTDEEYVEWGVRLGTDEQLRKEVSWKLRQSRQSAPLWNGKQFTRDMEAAYRQMWERFCAG